MVEEDQEIIMTIQVQLPEVGTNHHSNHTITNQTNRKYGVHMWHNNIFSNRGQWWTTGKLRALKRWGLTLVVGVVQAIIAVACNFASKRLSEIKYDHVLELFDFTFCDSSKLACHQRIR